MRLCQCILAFLAALFLFGRGAWRPQSPQEHRSQTISCSSEDGEKHYCEADTRYGARLVRQRSETPCKEGESWGYDEEGIWVDKGCARYRPGSTFAASIAAVFTASQSK